MAAAGVDAGAKMLGVAWIGPAPAPTDLTSSIESAIAPRNTAETPFQFRARPFARLLPDRQFARTRRWGFRRWIKSACTAGSGEGSQPMVTARLLRAGSGLAFALRASAGTLPTAHCPLPTADCRLRQKPTLTPSCIIRG